MKEIYSVLVINESENIRSVLKKFSSLSSHNIYVDFAKGKNGFFYSVSRITPDLILYNCDNNEFDVLDIINDTLDVKENNIDIFLISNKNNKRFVKKAKKIGIKGIFPNSLKKDLFLEKIIELDNRKIKKAPKNYDLNILVAESANSISETYKLWLTSINFTNITIVGSGKQAIDLYKKSIYEDFRFDVVIVDSYFPDMNGKGVLNEIRQFEKSIKEIDHAYSIFTSSVIDEKVVTEMISCEVDDFLVKPIDRQYFLSSFEPFCLNLEEAESH